MRHLRWQVLIAVLGMLLVARMLAGRGAAPTPVGGGTPAVASPAPASGGVYSEALLGAPSRFNPLLDFANPVDRDVDRLLFSGLTRFDAVGRPVPDLANWIISDDALTYTFVLRADARWHDGTPVTTADVAYTIGVLQDAGYPGPADVAFLWRAVKLNVINEQAVEFVLPEPFAPFLDYTAFGVLPAHLLGQVTAADLPNAPFNYAPVGSGPFRFAGLLGEGDEVTGVRLEANLDYYGQPPLLDEVEFKFYPDVAAALTAYQAGDVLGISRVDPAHVNQALALPRLGVYTALRPEYSLIFLNLQNDDLPFFKDKKVRQALLRGLNRTAMVDALLNGQAVPATSPVLPGSWAYNPDLPRVDYDPQAAAHLLDSAGWVIPDGATPGSAGYVRQKEGVPLQFTLTTPDDPLHAGLAEAAQATWAQLGIAVTLNPVDPAAVRSDYLLPRPRAFDALLVDLNLAGTPDPDPYPLWHETQVESGQNYGGFADRATSELLEQARITLDLETRARLYFKFQSRFADQTPALLLFYPVYTYAVDTRVSGVQVGPLVEPSDRLNGAGQWAVVTERAVAQP
jgi:peptide/nickel transport system substrate-binding protein